jgi:hypothetical protein
MSIKDLLETNVHSNFDSVTLKTFIKLAKQKHFTVNKTYQRSLIWRRKKQKALIESILKNYCIGLFTFKKIKNNQWEILDGQQRLHTIFSFVGKKLNNDIGTEKALDLDEYSYKKIKANTELEMRFFNNKIAFITIPADVKDDETAKYFIALQEGVPLNEAERLSARPGWLRDLIATRTDIRELSVICNDNCIKEYRFKRRYLLSQLLKFELDGDWKKLKFKNQRHPDLEKMYDEYKNPIGGVEKKMNTLYEHIKEVLYDIGKSIEGNEQIIKNTGYLIPIYLFSSYLNKNFKGVDPDEYGKFILKFVRRCKKSKTGNNDYAKFKKYVSGGTTAESINKRVKIFGKCFHKQFKRLIELDHVRNFSKDQKEDMLVRDKHKCFCNDKKFCSHQKVKLNNSEAHHIKFYCRGGPTNTKNGALCHPECHKKLHKRQGLDIES